jgi:hypothetical protein
LITQNETPDGMSSVEVTYDSEVPVSFPIEKLVSSKYIDVFSKCSDSESNLNYVSKSAMGTRNFLAIMSAIRSKGWNLVGTSATSVSEKHIKKSFYFEIILGRQQSMLCFLHYLHHTLSY